MAGNLLIQNPAYIRNLTNVNVQLDKQQLKEMQVACPDWNFLSPAQKWNEIHSPKKTVFCA